MRFLLVLACLLGSIPALHAQQVVLDLDRGYPEDQFYFLTYNDESSIEIKANTQGYNKKSARATWRVQAGAGALGYVGFGYFHGIAAPPNPFPDLSPYTHLSLWYNNTSVAAGAENVVFRFELYESEVESDPDGETGIQTWVYESAEVLSTPTGWTEVLLPLVETSTLGAKGFAIPEGGFMGDGVLDLDRIRHWGIVLVAENAQSGAVFQGVTLFDYLTAVKRTDVLAALPDTPATTLFARAYPNPFATSATFEYALESTAHVSLRVYDVMGREVGVVVPPQVQAAGPHRVVFDNSTLAAGTYVCVLQAGDKRLSQVLTKLP